MWTRYYSITEQMHDSFKHKKESQADVEQQKLKSDDRIVILDEPSL